MGKPAKTTKSAVASSNPAAVVSLLASLDPSVTGALLAEGETYTIYLAPIGRFSGDDRIIFDLGWREGSLPLTYSDSEMSHGDAVHVGNMSEFRYEEVDGTSWVVADVSFDDDATALEAKRMVDESKIRGVSVNLGAGWAVLFCRDELSETPTKEEVMTAAEDVVEADDPSYDCLRWAMGIFEAEIGAATIVVIPAFEDARVEPVLVEPVLAAAQEIADLMNPPRLWFSDPELTRPSGVNIDSEGRVTGHLAFWDSCHRGFGECVLAPRGTTYEAFHSNAVMSFGEQKMGVGCLTLDLNHADKSLGLEAGRDHYDHSGTVFAFVRVGEDAYGIWVSGALAPGLDAEKVEIARRMRLSGDWRPVDGHYELIAAQSVPVPGFVPRTLVASGQIQTLGPDASPLVSELVASVEVADLLGEIRDELARLTARNDEEALRSELAGLFDLETSTP